MSKTKTIRKATQAERIKLACRLINAICENTPAFEHAPKAKFILQSATYLISAPAPIRETVWRKLCVENPVLMTIAADDEIALDSASPLA